VNSIPASRSFFCDQLGFEVVTEVRHRDGSIGFCILQNDGAEIMLQTNDSTAADMPAIAGESFRTIVYIDVPDVKTLQEKIVDVEIVVPPRTTFYGADEIFVREPGGNIVGLATLTTEPQ
jgi:uncharacterized glyoxalase superfamily protein PhnB